MTGSFQYLAKCNLAKFSLQLRLTSGTEARRRPHTVHRPRLRGTPHSCCPGQRNRCCSCTGRLGHSVRYGEDRAGTPPGSRGRRRRHKAAGGNLASHSLDLQSARTRGASGSDPTYRLKESGHLRCPKTQRLQDPSFWNRQPLTLASHSKQLSFFQTL